MRPVPRALRQGLGSPVLLFSGCLIQQEQLRQTFYQREDTSPKKTLLSKNYLLWASTHYSSDFTPSSSEPQFDAQLVTNGFDTLDTFPGGMLDV